MTPRIAQRELRPTTARLNASQMEALCLDAGNLLLKPPKLKRTLVVSIRREKDPIVRWLELVHASQKFTKRFHLEHRLEGSTTERTTTTVKTIILCILFLFFICPGRAAGQVQRGTIVVIFYSPAKVILAADSRSQVEESNGVTLRNDECKLLALEPNLIAAFGGLVGGRVPPRDRPNGPPVFDAGAAHEIAREEASKLKHTELDSARVLASAWADRMQEFIVKVSRVDPNVIQEARKQSEEKNFDVSWSLFAATDSHGRLVLHKGVVYWNNQGNSFAAGEQELPLLQPPNQFVASSTSKSYRIFDRLKAENLPANYHTEWKDREAAKAIYLAEQTRDQANDDRIGGKIDAIELRRGARKAEWIQLKAGCPAN